MLVCIGVILLLSTITQTGAQCQRGWVTHGDSCYHFSHDKENWIDAQVVCEHFGANLVEIYSQDENNFLMLEIANRTADFWVGASDLMIENEWHWLSSNNNIDFSGWGPGEPSNSNKNENCVEIRYAQKDWNDRPCDYQTYYVCQKDMEPSEVVG